MSMPESHRVELGSVEVSPDGEGFVLGFIAPNQDVHRMQLPRWTLQQLMRMLPRLDAALVQARGEVGSDLIAYPVVQWCVERTGMEDTVALSVRDARHVESAYLFDACDAAAIHAALGEALATAS
jgi:hypothetical protein